jgi:27-O-demethylrifamycin SV methyltransferase
MAGVTAEQVGAFHDATLTSFSAMYDGSIHAGYFGRGAATLAEAQDHLTDAVVEACGVPAGGRVLDAGCGQGGPAIRAALRHGVRVTGVTLSPGQQKDATAAAARAGAAALVDFQVADMALLPFPDAHFDAAYAMESLLFHVADKQAAFAELARVLRPGAVLAIADYVASRPMSATEVSAAATALHGTPPCTVEEVRAYAAGRGSPRWRCGTSVPR